MINQAIYSSNQKKSPWRGLSRIRIVRTKKTKTIRDGTGGNISYHSIAQGTKTVAGRWQLQGVNRIGHIMSFVTKDWGKVVEKGPSPGQ